MFHRIREPFGKAGLTVAVIALVAALVGGAYAATGLNGKQKKEVETIAKKFAGKKGARGPAGPVGATGSVGAPGPQGAKGDTGANGADGQDGSPGTPGEPGVDGESVTIIPLSPGDANCPAGGTKLTNESGDGYACNGGGAGSDTMLGYWEVLGASAVSLSGFAVTTITFPETLDAAPAEVLMIDTGNTTEEKEKCPGSANNPQATAGKLCIYAPVNVTLGVSQPSKYGALLAFNAADKTYGTWAYKLPSTP